MSLLYLLVLSVVIVFVVGIAVDALRAALFAGVNWLLMHLSVYRKMLLKIDTMTGPEKDGKEVL